MAQATRLIVLILLVCVAGSSFAAEADPLARRASWQLPDPVEIKRSVHEWADSLELNELQQEQIKALWPEQGGPQAPNELVEQLGVTAAIVDAEAGQLMTIVQRARNHPLPPKFEFVLQGEASEDQPPVPSLPGQLAEQEEKSDELPLFIKRNLRLLYGRWLAQHDLYDESLDYLGSLSPDQVADPASLLFYQAVGHHKLLNKDKCLPAIERLLERDSEIPRRYETVARLMEADIKPLETDSLDEIARLMSNIQRRLDLGRAGERVRTEEELVLKKLDKMIEQIEKQQQQQQQQQAGGGGQGSNPLPDSVPAGGRGPGNVTQRDIGNGSGWGNLPPKERQEALQEITKDLPAHYRTVIEEYFRKLARNQSSTPPSQ